VEEKDLQDMDFPIVFKICVTPGFDEVALQEAGYDSTNSYFYGTSIYNETTIGWAGHTSKSGVQGSVAEILRNVRGHTIDDVIESIYFYKKDGSSFYINTTEVHRMLNYPDNCYTLDLTNNADVKEGDLVELFIHFGDIDTVEVFIQGTSLACDRIIKDHRLYSSGDRIRWDGMVDRRNYVVKIKKNIFVEEDPTKTCENYPNSYHASYRDCDHQWMKNTVASEAPGLVPVWLAENLTMVTKQYDSNSATSTILYENLFDGTFVSDCPLPCTTLYTETRFISQEFEEQNMIDITFSPKVQVTTTDLVKLPLSSFLSNVGGSLGLWLGLGAVQAMTMLINCVLSRRCQCRDKMTKRRLSEVKVAEQNKDDGV
jgi:hypothetical protein